ncbi:CPBP family intramembrane glutamic endopeptidase [Dietzia aurantiaca]|uniref:CPBP family intramembrane glutamic endopeptidase n=1 Tax=Dietzia aurantiaca TaxID=983873 RepID=UPI001E296594|nr:CPBP family intramembrane glutamic endopeptidase [Dietzia aurantiaca]
MNNLPGPRQPLPATGAPHGAPGLWTTPIRGRVAVAALGWVLVYIAGAVVVVLLGMLAVREWGSGRPPAAPLALTVLAGTAVAALAAVRTHLLRRRRLRWADLGLRRPDRSPLHLLWQIPAVMGTGMVASMFVLIPLAPAGATGDDAASEALGDLVSGGPAYVMLGLATVAVLVPVVEEIVFRGIVLPALRARYRAAVGITLAGGVFAAVHFVPPALPYLLVVGISLCAMAEWYRSIVPGIVLHGVNNAIVFTGVVAGAGAL